MKRIHRRTYGNHKNALFYSLAFYSLLVMSTSIQAHIDNGQPEKGIKTQIEYCQSPFVRNGFCHYFSGSSVFDNYTLDILLREESLIKDLQGANRLTKSEDILSRKEKEGINFLFPEARDALLNMRESIQYVQQYNVLYDQGVLAELHDDINQVIINNFHYQEVIQISYLYASVIDKVNYDNYYRYYLNHHMSNLPLPDDERIQRSFLNESEIDTSPNVFHEDVIHYPVNTSDRELYTCIKTGISDVGNREKYLRYLSHKTMCSLFTQKFHEYYHPELNYVLFPTFSELDLYFFIKTTHLKIYPLGLTKDRFSFADGRVKSTFLFLYHDAFHARFRAPRLEDIPVAETFINELDNLPQSKLKDEILLYLFFIAHELISGAEWKREVCFPKLPPDPFVKEDSHTTTAIVKTIKSQPWIYLDLNGHIPFDPTSDFSESLKWVEDITAKYGFCD